MITWTLVAILVHGLSKDVATYTFTDEATCRAVAEQLPAFKPGVIAVCIPQPGKA